MPPNGYLFNRTNHVKGHLSLIILKSDKNFNKNGIIKFCHFAPFLMLPGCPVFHPITMAWTVFVEGQSRTCSTKLIWNQTSGVWAFSRFLKPQQPKFSTECKSLNNFERVPTHSCEVKLKLVQCNGTYCHV